MFAIGSIEDGLRLTWSDQLLLEYHFQTGGSRTYWHPLRMPDSPVLTMDRPDDHIHHQGIWVAWKKVNGVNFWEQPKPGADPNGFGRIVHKKVLESSADSQAARFVTQNEWVDWRSVIHLNEVRRTVVYAPQDNHLIMDITLQFHPAGRDVTLDLNRGEPGRGGLFYSGLTIRFDNAMTPGRLLDADGRTETMDIFGSRSRWCGYAGRHQEDGQVYGMTVLDHPRNSRYPTAWWVRNSENYALIQPGLCYHEPFHLPAGDTLELEYRIVFHKGYVDTELIEGVEPGRGGLMVF
jgi:hypothetical protein